MTLGQFTTLKNHGIGVNIKIPENSVSGSIPAWVFYSGIFLLSAGSITAWYFQSRQKSKADVKAEEAKRDKVKIECETKLALAKIKQEGVSKGPDATDCNCSSGNADAEDLPDWKDATSYSDRAVDSTLIGQSGGIVLINGREGQGKSTLAIQLMVEACEGKSSGLRNEDNGVVGSRWEGYLYASESSPKFKSCYGAKLEDICAQGVFKARVNDPNWRNYKRVLSDIRRTALRSNKNCIFGIDNVTDMFPEITEREISFLKNELEAIRADVEKSGRMVGFIIVTHANTQTGDVSGSKLWQKLPEINIFITEDKKADNPDCKIVNIKKNRFGPEGKIRVRRVISPYMHFECEDSTPKDADDNESEAQPPEMEIDTRLPVTPEIEDEFASIYQPGVYGYRQIYNDFKDIYQLKSKDTVKNAIVRSQKRKTAA